MQLFPAAMELLRRLGYFFYIVEPSKNMFEKPQDVKNYFIELYPILVSIFTIQSLKEILEMNPNEGRHISVRASSFLFTQVASASFHGMTTMLYVWLYTNFRIITLPWDSYWTWILAYFLIDFLYYCTHRMFHEVNLLWALHETHHVPETMCISITVSLHFLQMVVHSIIISPSALVLPPTVILVHHQLNLMSQVWFHTEFIKKLPRPIEYIFNTPSHHRVHHGMNRKYIDKNYGGILIIWDRMFGTFEKEDPEEKPIYGTTSQIKSFNHLEIQTYQFRKIWDKFQKMKGFRNKLSAIFKGPGWSPGKPWTGVKEDILHPPIQYEFHIPNVLIWTDFYSAYHIVTVSAMYIAATCYFHELPRTSIITINAYVVFAQIVSGFILNRSRFAAPLEIVRCLLHIAVESFFYDVAQKYGNMALFFMEFNRIVGVFSIMLWTLVSLQAAIRKMRNTDVKNPLGHTKPDIASYMSCHSSAIRSIVSIIRPSKDQECKTN